MVRRAGRPHRAAPRPPWPVRLQYSAACVGMSSLSLTTRMRMRHEPVKGQLSRGNSDANAMRGHSGAVGSALPSGGCAMKHRVRQKPASQARPGGVVIRFGGPAVVCHCGWGLTSSHIKLKTESFKGQIGAIDLAID